MSQYPDLLKDSNQFAIDYDEVIFLHRSLFSCGYIVIFVCSCMVRVVS